MTEPTNRPLFERLTPARKWALDGPSLVRLLGVCWVGAAGWYLDSELSLAIGVGLVVLGVLSRPLVVVAVGHAALIALVPDLLRVSSLVSLGLFEGGLLLLLVSERPMNPVVAVLTVSGATALAAISGVGTVEFGLVAGGTLIVVALGTVSYLLHRYEQFSVQRILDGYRETDSDTSYAAQNNNPTEQTSESTGPQETTNA